MPDPSTPAGQGLHVPFIKSRLPDWTQHLLGRHLQAMTQARDPVQQFIKACPSLFAQASPARRQALLDSQAASKTSSQRLAKTLEDFKGITEFTKPLLVEAMGKRFGQAPDVLATHLFHLRAPNQAGEQSLLQAALRNFEEDEPFDEVSLQETSALAPAGSLEQHLYDETKHYPFGKTRYSIRDKLSIKPAAFASLCRELDLGKQYQDHLSAMFEAPAKAATVRQQTIAANKDRMRLQAHIARIRADIDEAAYATLLAVLDGAGQARFDGQPVAFSRLEVFGSVLSDVLIIGAASRQIRATLENPWCALLPGGDLAQAASPPESRFVVYIPGDPLSPIKQYTTAQAFSKDLAIKLRSTRYQRFFASLVPHDESAGFLRRLKSQLKVMRWNSGRVDLGPPFKPGSFAQGIYEEVWNEAVNLGLDEHFIAGEVFGARYDFHLARIKSEAKLLVVPTAEVDHKAWVERLKHYAESGLNVLNVAAFFVPGLGEVMLAVTAMQLGYEVYQGLEAWKEGDAEDAWMHLKSVLENVAFMAVLGAAAAGKAPSIVPSRFVNGMTQVASPFGRLRLWHPDLSAYKGSVSLEGLKPDSLGQYHVAGKIYIGIEGNAYEKTFDPALKRWRIKHPTEIDAYQPILRYNGFGAWRHDLERPLEWSRATLLRRLGPHMEHFTDVQLEQIADVSGVSDDSLRAMHVDHQPPPPVLAEVARLFEEDRQAGAVADQTTVPPDADTQRLQRSFPSLSSDAAQHVLGSASADEVGQLRSTERIPLHLAREIRVHLHQGSLNRALAGLYLESLASTASDRLALHSLEQLPGWSADTRVEVRSLGIRGPLVDSIGSEQASIRYYLIRSGDHFRTLDAEGRALNSVPSHGRNLFESLLEVVPEALRRSLQGKPSEALHKQVADYACSHRDDMSRILKRDLLKKRAGRLLRRPSGQFGYAASGDVAGFADEPLIARVRDIYPNVSDQQALQFIRNQLSAGSTDQQVFHLLENRRREFDGLRAVLNTWVEGAAPQFPRRPGWPGQADFAERIIACWRNGIYRGQAPAFDLDLLGADALPQWVADFSHVRKLRVSSAQLTDGTLVQRFGALEGLDIHIAVADMPALARELPALPSLTELKLELAIHHGAYLPALSQALQGMTRLERLHLKGSIPALDYRALTGLRALTLAGNLREWPAGLLALDGLELADLSGVEIPALPDALFSGHAPLWRRLHLNWKALEPRAFMKVFEYVHDNPAHLVDESQIVAQYCRQRLQALVPQDQAFAASAMATFSQDGLAGRALLEQVEALHERYRVWNEALLEWQGRGVRVEGWQMPAHHREALAERIRGCWRDALAARYASREPVAGPSRRMGEPAGEVLDLTGYGALGDLPALGDVVFPQVRHLNLAGAKLSAPQVNEFLGRFPQLRILDLSRNTLTELPQAIEALGQLSELNLSGNELTITASTQTRINRLSGLERLDLSRNRVGTLAVTALTDLVSLNLGQTQIRAWPTGVLALPKLGFLDLSRSAITGIPDAALVGHDVLLAGTSLRGCRLGPQAMATAQAFARRTGPGTPLATMFVRPFGIDRGVLAAGRTGGDPVFFPVEVSEQPDLLLPLPLDTQAGNALLTSAERLQRLDPQLGAAQAIERIDAWLAQGVSATEIETALRQWQAQQAHMITRFNGWIDTPAVRNRDGWVSATDRRRAADRLLACWRETLRDVRAADRAASDYAVDLSALTLGDLPALPVIFHHVGALDLSNIGLTTASDEFLRAFPRLNSLMLSGNGLGTLPEAVTQYEHLTRLGASQNDLSDAGLLQRQLRALPHLQAVDLEGNSLDAFDVTGLERLQSLNLRGNRLSDWPVGALQAPVLTALDLRSNYNIERIPPDAFLPEHADLMAGTDLSDNLLLEVELIRLRAYQHETGLGLGFTTQEIDEMLAGYGPETDGEHLGDHPEQESPDMQRARWFDGVAADSEKHAIWDSVMARDTTGDFSSIVAQLRHSRDFQLDRVNLAERVWEVMEAAYGDSALSERLMGIARASRHGVTCGDGRMLLFNALEIEVYESNALRSIDPANKGRALLKLSRGLFRLDQVEEVAKRRSQQRTEMDPAEIRLGYRIGLAQRLQLPRQPRSMLHGSGLGAADLDTAHQAIIALEKTPVFIEQLTARQYWVDYLQEKYPAEFARVQQALEDKASVLEDQHPEINPAYLQQMEALQKANKVERQALITRLSTRELAELGN
jgi:Leucine-rich repeat (LRR) protein